MNKSAFTALAAATAALAACSAPAPTVVPATDTPAASSPVAPAPVTPTTAAATSTPTDRSAKFGDTVTFEDGTKVKVTSGGFVKAEPMDKEAVEGRIAVVNLSVTAGREEINASMMALTKATVGPEGRDVPQLYSSSLRGGGFSTILPGETQTIKVGYGISAADAKNVRIEIRGPNASDRSAIFKGAIG